MTAAAGAHAFYEIKLDLGSEIPDRQVAALLVEHEMEGRRHGYLSLLYGFKWQGRVYKRWGGTGGAVEGRGGWEGRRGGCRGRPCWLRVCFVYGAHPLSGYHYPPVRSKPVRPCDLRVPGFYLGTVNWNKPHPTLLLHTLSHTPRPLPPPPHPFRDGEEVSPLDLVFSGWSHALPRAGALELVVAVLPPALCPWLANRWG